MNKRIARELKNELSFIEAGIDVEKHAYTMQRLLELLSDSQSEEPESRAKSAENVTIHRAPAAKIAADEDDDGNGKDIFDF